jgi:hypothetical protein
VSRVHGAAWSIVDRAGDADKRRWRIAGERRAGTSAHRCSLVVAEEDEQDEAVPEGCSPEHKQRGRGGTTMVKGGGGSSLA